MFHAPKGLTQRSVTSEMEGCRPYQGVGGVEVSVGNPVGLAVCVTVDVNVLDGVIGVQEGVNVGVIEGVREEVIVTEGVQVAGTKGVSVIVLVEVFVGVSVIVGVLLAVAVTIGGVSDTVGEGGVAVNVKVEVTNVGETVGVKSEGVGASATAIQPMQ